MIKISGLPVQITKADLDEIFAPYGKIRITEDSILIKIGENRSTAYVELDQNEQRAIEELSGKRWADSELYLDYIRGDELVKDMPDATKASPSEQPPKPKPGNRRRQRRR